jgi:ABC-2 type transport system permease protein
MSWVFEASKLEAKRFLSYRVDFWLQFAVSVLAEVVIAYFLWSSIYGDDPNKLIGGYTFHQMLMYYLFVPFVGRMVRSHEDFSLATEIKEGGLNKFLIYPLSFLQYKIMQKFVYTSLAVMQMFLGLFFVAYLLGLSLNLNFANFSLGILAAFSSMLLYSMMLMTLEMVAFWADTVWSLGVMLRFIAMFFGGSFIPLKLFPMWSQKILMMTPFPYLFSNTIKTFIGEYTPEQSLEGIVITLLWVIPLGAIMVSTYKRGLKQYSGIGI